MPPSSPLLLRSPTPPLLLLLPRHFLFSPLPTSSSSSSSSSTLSLRTLLPHPLLSPLRPLRRRRRRSCSAAAADQDLLQALVGASDAAGDEPRSHLPALRSYEGDLASLTLTGAVAHDQALTAAAADGGAAAEEHLSSGADAMIVETVFPGSPDERSTVSTRLFLPAKKVREKAKKLRRTLAADVLSGSSTNPMAKNILAMTFRQVVMERLWSFRLSIFSPGTERDMEDLAKPREVITDFVLSSSDERVLSALAEAVCSCAVASNEKNYLGSAGGLFSNNTFGWLQKPQRNCSLDSSVCVYRIPEGEVVKSAMKQLERFNLVKGDSSCRERILKHRWWPPPYYKRLEKMGGSGFVAWTNEFIPAYRLQIDANVYKEMKLEGWQELTQNRWEALLTHSQMMELGNILDMYYEDQFTLPEKQLSCGLISDPSNIPKKNSSLKTLFAAVAVGCVAVFVGIAAQLYWPHVLRVKKASEANNYVLPSETYCCDLQTLDAAELETSCIYVVKTIKDALGWPGDIMFDANIGAWIGMLPSYLRSLDLDSRGENRAHVDLPNSISSHSGTNKLDAPDSISSHSETNNLDAHAIGQDIASFQVVLSGDGKIVGFQPTSRVAVNQWASNPLAEILYGGRKLSPGILEPNLHIPCPSKVILIELLVSTNTESPFALARPIYQPH
ncbi:uncharacterized protein LOC109718190 [Ananas comosus]|uniref:Uncharacterized protein LOC109718190 n=1 Tax=Ananas comosus TaxID=4615 RepID=A0A6P5FU78_ANACO|nr:uncharacterized protein LOC109718190 [Ananas comosus]XP_020099845.1 uncharacterized protein LOC109718190 [Ananas comosus]XP_020099846.1 uncharacterized protein LOC109718190 [Ananas comosus]